MDTDKFNTLITKYRLNLDPIPDSPKVKVYVKCNLHDLWTKPIVPPVEDK